MVFVHELVYAYPVFTSLSTLVNIILAALIVFRLVYYRRHVQNALGAKHASLHQRHNHLCRIFSTDGHFQRPVHRSGVRVTE